MPTNRLAQELSPYLLQHAHNPVDWFPWSQEAFDKAKSEHKPIFLSIGYATCHWCHVMERESFENPAVAEVLNTHFISIKVDREERPDIDHLYMQAVQAMSGQGGWPLSVWLTPDLIPFYGGTYFPPQSRYQRPGFIDVLKQIHQAWTDKESDLRRSSQKLVDYLKFDATATTTPDALPSGLIPDALAQAVSIAERMHDAQHGGFSHAPKFPRPWLPLFLLRYAEVHPSQKLRQIVEHTCLKMIQGGIHDQVGGGFHRYSVDELWLVPHFEKMLYDNAQLMQLFAELHLASPQAWLATAAEQIHDYLQRDMRHAQGAFYSAEDADSEGKEGLFYCWTEAELRALLTPDDFALTQKTYGITPHGNFEDHSDPNPPAGLNVLSIVQVPATEAETQALHRIRQTLLHARSSRTRPLLDDKILTSWNAQLISGYAWAGIAFNRKDYLQTAQEIANFLQTQLTVDGTLRHRWRNGVCDSQAFLEDYATLALAYLDLYHATLDPNTLAQAQGIVDKMIAQFYDTANGAFWQSTDSSLLTRMKPDYDGAEPSGNSLAVHALLRLSTLLHDESYRYKAEHTLRYFRQHLTEQPHTVPCLMASLLWLEQEPTLLVLAGEPAHASFQALHRTALSVYHPQLLILHATPQHPAPFIQNLAQSTTTPTAHFCSQGSCKLPTTDPAELHKLLQRTA